MLAERIHLRLPELRIAEQARQEDDRVPAQAISFHISRSRRAVQMRGCLMPRASS